MLCNIWYFQKTFGIILTKIWYFIIFGIVRSWYFQGQPRHSINLYSFQINPMVPNQSKVRNDAKSAKITWDSIECRTIKRSSTILIIGRLIAILLEI